jgi:hypothetical protein
VTGFGDEILIIRGPTLGTDQSSAGNNCTLVNSLGVTADTNNNGISAFVFNANDKRIVPPTAVNLPATGNWSFGCWYLTSLAGEGTIFTNNNFQSGRTDLKTTSLLSGTYRTFTFVNGSPSSVVMYSPNTSNTNSWRLGVWQREGNVFRIYDNGAIAVEATVSVSIDQTTEFTIGGRPKWTTAEGVLQAFSGRADDIRRSNTVWTADQIAAWWTNGRGYDVKSSRRRRYAGGYGL